MSMLATLLANCYGERKALKPPGQVAKLEDVLRQNPEMLAEARSYYASLGDEITQKCVLSRTFKEVLSDIFPRLGIMV